MGSERGRRSDQPGHRRHAPEASRGRADAPPTTIGARALAFGSRIFRPHRAKRRRRAESGRHAGENARLLVALQERQVLHERLSQIQRSIVSGSPLYSIFDEIVQAAVDLISADSAVLRLRDRGAERSSLVASVGASPQFLTTRRRSEEPGLSARAMLEERLISVDPGTGSRAQLRPEWLREGLLGAVSAPIFERGEAVGSLTVGVRNGQRKFDVRDHQSALALAEHAGLAIAHSHALEDAAHKALHDPLTGLPNRALFLDRTELAIARAGRSGIPVGVLFVDLDDFKTINDSLGHSAGDSILLAAGERLRDCLDPSDTIARLGGDEFAILLEELHLPGDAASAAQQLLDALEQPFMVGEREVFIGACVGIAAGTSDGETLLRDADLAMYRAKDGGRGRYEVFAPEMHTAMVDRLDFEVDLKRGIAGDQLDLLYQPIFSLRTGRIAGLEALVRWNHPTRGRVTPSRFISMAEASGQIHALGRWVLDTACHQAALWRARYPALPGIQVGVNVSAAQLGRSALVDDVAHALERAQLEPEALTLEITETALMHDIDAAVTRLRALKLLGVGIAVDDFGIGHASLGYLKRFPLDNLKVAREFVEGMSEPGGEDVAILRAIIELAEVFELRAVAEGIETEAQRLRLLEFGCELGQGFLLSEPITADAADDLILQTGLLTAAPQGSPENRVVDALRRSGSAASRAPES